MAGIEGKVRCVETAMTDELEAIREFVHRGQEYPDLRGELAAAKAEIDNLKHELMKLRFENSGLYAKLDRLIKEFTEF